MKVLAYHVKVEIKPEGFRALCFSKLLTDEGDNAARITLEDLLKEFEKGQFHTKMSRKEENPNVFLDLERHDLNIFFDGACSRKETLGSYAFVVRDG